MLFLQSVRFAADRPHVWVSGAGWGWDWLWPKAAAWRSGFSAGTKSVWKQISTQVALTARTCQWGMLGASGNKTRQTSPTSCSSLVYSVHSFTLPFLSLIQQCGQQVHSLSPPGGKQIPEEECNKALSLSLCLSLTLSLWVCVCVCVCAVAGRWAVLQSLPNKLVYTHTGKTDNANQSLQDTSSTDVGFFLQSDRV